MEDRNIGSIVIKKMPNGKFDIFVADNDEESDEETQVYRDIPYPKKILEQIFKNAFTNLLKEQSRM